METNLTKIIKIFLAYLVLELAIPDIANAAFYNRGNGLVYDDVLNVTWSQDANLFKSMLDNSGEKNIFIEKNGFSSTLDFNINTGAMTWAGATSFINYLNINNFSGFNDWRLPSISPINGNNFIFSSMSTEWFTGNFDNGYNINSIKSELGYLFYSNLGLKAVISNGGVYQPDFGIFRNGVTNYDGDSYVNHIVNAPVGQTNIGLIKNIQDNRYWGGESILDNSLAWIFGFGSNPGYQETVTKSFYQFYVIPVRDGDVREIPEPPSITFVLIGLIIISKKHKIFYKYI